MPRSGSDDRFAAFAIAAPGIERITAAELASLDIAHRPEEGGVSFDADWPTLRRANLELRTASRVIVRAGNFRVRALGELVRRGSALPWERFLTGTRPVQVRVTSRKSRLYHTGAVAQRVVEGISARLGRVIEPARTVGDEEDPGDAQLVIVRLLGDECLLSVDSSGALLHMRGYRQAVGRAPMRETLAAAMLLAAGYDGSLPLLDPLCGSGTIPIEGALLARRIAPGAQRGFAFEHWPGCDADAWRAERARSADRTLRSAPQAIIGSDRDAGAVDGARSNAERARVGEDVQFVQRALSAADISATEGWLVTNPPYGVRVGDQHRLRDLYARLGQLHRERFAGWRLVMVASDPKLAAHVGVRFRELFRTRTGGLPVRIVMADGAS